MVKDSKTFTVLMADDDEDDRLLARDAFEESASDVNLQFVEDGQELLEYLHGHGVWANHPTPSLILLDLNMPRKDGREALAAIKDDPTLRRIPIVIVSTSKAEEDVTRSYELGVSSFISKPVTYESLVSMVEALTHYWFRTVRLPGQTAAD